MQTDEYRCRQMQTDTDRRRKMQKDTDGCKLTQTDSDRCWQIQTNANRCWQIPIDEYDWCRLMQTDAVWCRLTRTDGMIMRRPTNNLFSAAGFWESRLVFDRERGSLASLPPKRFSRLHRHFWRRIPQVGPEWPHILAENGSYRQQAARYYRRTYKSVALGFVVVVIIVLSSLQL